MEYCFRTINLFILITNPYRLLLDICHLDRQFAIQSFLVLTTYPLTKRYRKITILSIILKLNLSLYYENTNSDYINSFGYSLYFL